MAHLGKSRGWAQVSSLETSPSDPRVLPSLPAASEGGSPSPILSPAHWAPGWILPEGLQCLPHPSALRLLAGLGEWKKKGVTFLGSLSILLYKTTGNDPQGKSRPGC